MRGFLLYIFLLSFVALQAQMEESYFWADTPVVKQQVQQPVKKIIAPKLAPVIPDSIFEGGSTFLYDSLFSTQYGTNETEIYPHRVNAHAEDYKFAIILLVMLVYVTWITYTYHKELSENFTVIVNMGLGQQIYRDREFSANIFKLITFSNFAVIIGITIYLIAVKAGIPLLFETLWMNIAAAVGVVIVAYLFKGVVYRLVSATYKLGSVFSFFRFNALVIYQLLGIGLFPLITLAVFAKAPVNTWALYAAVACIGIALLIRIYRGFTMLGMVKGFHILYFLLYICALEIAPVLILVKLFSKWA